MNKYIAVFFIVLWFIPSVYADTFYVRPSGGSYGDEDGSSYANAYDGFSDITWGGAGVTAGDTLYVCGGHGEQLTVNSESGTPGNNIVIDCNCPDLTGSWDLSGTVTGWSGPDGNGEYTAGLIPQAKVVHVENPSRVIYTPGTIGSLGATEFGWTGDTLYLGSDPSGGTVTVAMVSYAVFINNTDYITVQNCNAEFPRLAGFEVWASGKQIQGHLFDNLSVTYSGAKGVFFNTSWTVAGSGISNGAIEDCTVNYSMGSGFSVSGHTNDVTVTRCLSETSGIGPNVGEGGHGFTLGGSALNAPSGWTSCGGCAANTYQFTLPDAAFSDMVTRVVERDDAISLVEGSAYDSLSDNEWKTDSGILYINLGGSDPNSKEVKYSINEQYNIVYTDCVARNTVDFNGIEGHGFSYDGFSKNNTSLRCLSYDNEGVGFTSNMGFDNVVAHSIAYGNLKHGFGNQSGGKQTSYYNNIAYNNTQSGFNIAKNAVRNRVVNNIALDNGTHGFWLGAGASFEDERWNMAYGNTTDFSNFTQDSTSFVAPNPFVDAAGGDFELAGGAAINGGGAVIPDAYAEGIMPGSSWPSSVTTGDQQSYGFPENGAYIYNRRHSLGSSP